MDDARDTPVLSPPKLPAAPKIPSKIPPPNNVALALRTLVDLVVVVLIYLASRNHTINGETFVVLISGFLGIRVSDVATTRKSSGGDPPIAGGLTGALMGVGGTIIDMIRGTHG